MVKSSAVVDDRTMRGPPDQVEAALRAVFRYDDRAGHNTHPDKVTLTACADRDKTTLAKWNFDGISPTFMTTQKLVGDVVTVLRNGAKQLANSRLEFAIRAAARIKATECSMAAKAFAMHAAAIPKMVPSTLWTKPMESKLNTLRTAIISTVIGRKNSLRCPEVVMSVCLNPIRSDPKSILLFRTLLDARRLMLKSVQRKTKFIEQLYT